MQPRELAPAVIVVDGTLCTISAAISSANADTGIGLCSAGSGTDTIQLEASAVLSVVENTVDGPNGLPSVTSRIIIEGGGYAIERKPGVEDFRVFRVGAGGDLTLEDLTIQHGIAASGGAILNRGRLSLYNTTIGKSRAEGSPAFGGGIDNLGYARIVNSRIVDNWAKDRITGPYYTHGQAYGGGSTPAPARR